MEKNGTCDAPGDKARKHKVLERIAFKINEGETVLHVDHDAKASDKRIALFFIITIAWVPTVEFYTFTVLPGFANGDEWLMIATKICFIISVVVTVLVLVCRKQFTKLVLVNMTIFTDKAVYITNTMDKKRIVQLRVNRVPWEDIKAYKIDFLFSRRSPRVTISTSFNIDRTSFRLPMSGEPGTTKRIFESLIYRYNPFKKQRADYLAKQGSPPDKMSFPVAPALLRRLKLRRLRMALFIPPADITSIWLAQWIVDSIAFLRDPVFLYWMILGMVYFFAIMIIIVQFNDFLHMFWFPVTPESSIQVHEGYIDQQQAKRAITADFSRDLLVSVGKSVSSPDHISTCSNSTPGVVTRFGPVDDVFGCYYTVMEQVHGWLEQDGYFMGNEEIQGVAIGNHPYMVAIARKIAGTAGSEQSINDHLLAAIARVQGTIDRTEDIYRMLVPMTLDAARQSLMAPIERYVDVFETGEKVLFIHHPARKNARPGEVLATTGGLILASSMAGNATFQKARYSEMISIKIGELDNHHSAFDTIMIELRPGASVPRIVLGSVIVDSPLFAILYKEAGLVINA